MVRVKVKFYEWNPESGFWNLGPDSSRILGNLGLGIWNPDSVFWGIWDLEPGFPDSGSLVTGISLSLLISKEFCIWESGIWESGIRDSWESRVGIPGSGFDILGNFGESGITFRIPLKKLTKVGGARDYSSLALLIVEGILC